MTTPTIELDCRGMKCPAPILALAREAAALRSRGGTLSIRADDPAFRLDVQAWTQHGGVELLEFTEHEGSARALILVAAPPAAEPPGVPGELPELEPSRSASLPVDELVVSLDLRNLECPAPILSIAKLCAQHPPGTELRVTADDPAFTMDLRAWLQSSKAELLELDDSSSDIRARLRILPPRPTSASSSSSNSAVALRAERCTLLVMHNDFEALMAALLVANGAAALGMQTSVFFTFWGLSLLRGQHLDPTGAPKRPTWRQRLFKWFLPKSPQHHRLGKLHFGGLGTRMLHATMQHERLLGLPELMREAQAGGVTFIACTMSMSLIGLSEADLYPYPNLEYAGVTAYVERARVSSLSLVF